MKPITVRELMTEDVKTVKGSDTLATVYDLMDSAHIRHLPVVDDDGQLIGILSNRDLFRATALASSELPMSAQRQVLEGMQVDEIMNTAPETIDPRADIREAGELLMEHKMGCLPVVEGDSLVGILTESDFVRYVVEQ